MKKITFKKFIHPVLVALMKSQRKHQLHIVTQKVSYEGGVIYVVNHSCRYDFPIAGEVIGRHTYTYVLVGKQRFEFIDKICLLLNGIIWVDRMDRQSKQEAFCRMIHLLKHGENICMFPEGTWNLTPSKPMLPLYWGCISLAKETKCPIQPLVLEYQGKDCFVNFGELFFVKEEDTKEEKIEELTDLFATLKWDIWEKFPVLHRKDDMAAEWEAEVARRIAEYPKLNAEYEKRCELKN